jgi:hypothetical protein
MVFPRFDHPGDYVVGHTTRMDDVLVTELRFPYAGRQPADFEIEVRK